MEAMAVEEFSKPRVLRDAPPLALAVEQSTKPPLEGRKPVVREASPLEVYNIPLFEIPPMLDVRSELEFRRSHILCAVSVPSDDGLDKQQLFQRILDHDEVWGWCLQHPLVIVHDVTTSDRVQWLVDVLTDAVVVRAEVDDFQRADRSEQLLRRLGHQCKQILIVSHQQFAQAFGFCCLTGDKFAAPFFDKFGPLPRCASLLQPRIFLAGHQVKLSEELLRMLGVTHAVVNADFWDIMDGTSGGGCHRCFHDRYTDVAEIAYLKCEIPDREDDDNLLQVLQGAAEFLMRCAAQGGVAIVCMDGQSRSAAVVCAFIMLSSGKSVQDAWQIFQESCIKIDSSLIWWDALRRLHKRPQKRAIADVLPAGYIS